MRMKKYNKGILVILLSTLVLLSCSEDDAGKNYAASIKDKIWWGTLTNAGEGGPQYFSVHFNADNSLQWSQLAGDYEGQWVVDQNKITLTFTGLDVIVTAEISDDNTWTNITTNTPNKVNSGELAENLIMNLDNTFWNGAQWPINAPGLDFSSKILQLQFKPDFIYGLHIPSSTAIGFSYEKSPTGGFFRIKMLKDSHPAYFGVIVSDREIRGTNSDLFTFQLIKQ